MCVWVSEREREKEGGGLKQNLNAITTSRHTACHRNQWNAPWTHTQMRPEVHLQHHPQSTWQHYIYCATVCFCVCEFAASQLQDMVKSSTLHDIYLAPTLSSKATYNKCIHPRGYSPEIATKMWIASSCKYLNSIEYAEMLQVLHLKFFFSSVHHSNQGRI